LKKKFVGVEAVEAAVGGVEERGGTESEPNIGTRSLAKSKTETRTFRKDSEDHLVPRASRESIKSQRCFSDITWTGHNEYHVEKGGKRLSYSRVGGENKGVSGTVEGRSSMRASIHKDMSG